MHSRCCWPPDIPKAFCLSRSLTSSHSAARRRARSTISSILPFIPSTRGPNAMFSKIDFGNGLGFWNTMPMRLRTCTGSMFAPYRSCP